MSNTISIEDFTSTTQQSVELICASFTQPDDDFLPVMQVQNGEGEMFVFGFDPAFLATEQRKDVLAERMMKPIIEGVGGKMLATTLSAWSVQFDMPGVTDPAEARRLWQEEGVPASQHPNRIEVVIVTVMSAFETRSYSAQIIRHDGKPPTLGPWEDWNQPGMTLEGRFVDGVQDKLRDSSGKADPEFIARLQAARG